MIDAVRAWFRPHCDAVRGSQTWRDVLSEIGPTRDGLHRFDMFMAELARAARRPLDIRCRCAHEFAGDETRLLQSIACLQSNDRMAARVLLTDWITSSAIDRLADNTHWFAMTLLDAGVIVSKRARRATYFH
ncbi:hypothetical protein [Caballeronia novacaledonica]|uniref:hypothetical protein n=1 Tax=Caballeronia novacaledonica TaxID=1544861 RepID=UPI001FE67258|nr:hypothetical protein [Caballeronia novacaledonica]